MSDELLLAEVQSTTRAFAVVQTLTGLLTDRVLADAERIEELTGDVAELGTRVSELERAARNDHSLTVVGRERFRTLDELAAVLRAEFAAEVESLTQRIDHVHAKTLRALTALVERKPA